MAKSLLTSPSLPYLAFFHGRALAKVVGGGRRGKRGHHKKRHENGAMKGAVEFENRTRETTKSQDNLSRAFKKV